MREIAGNFINHIITNLIYPFELQDHIVEGDKIWCLDWWIIEICKYFFEGETAYARYPIARRLEGNPLFQKEQIIKAARNKELIMQSLAVSVDRLAVLETARGFDTLLATTVKDWEQIYVVIDSEYPEVIAQTKRYLERFPAVQIIGRFDILREGYCMMKTQGFEGRK